jgi:membrane protein implicated in regulation of membrane protease activity
LTDEVASHTLLQEEKMFTPAIIWLIIGLIFIASEFFVPGFVIFFFGSGAILTAILTAFIPFVNSSIILQTLIWLGASVFSLCFLRKHFAKIFKGRLQRPEQKEVEDSGKKATVIKAITPERPGRIRFQGTSWRAASYTESFKPGDTVDILKKEGFTFIVSKKILPGFIEPDDE